MAVRPSTRSPSGSRRARPAATAAARRPSRIASLLPAHLRWAASPATPPTTRRFPATLLVADISGYTLLTEKLARHGRRGAEEVSGVVNAALAPAVGAIARHGGSIVGFAGDSVLALFTGSARATRALAVAASIARSFERRGSVATSAGEAHLTAAIVVHDGIVHAHDLGSAGRRVHVICGPALQSLARHEASAPPGKTLVTTSASRQARREPPPRGASRRPREPPAREALLAPYLPPHLRAVPASFEGEFRRAAILFLETRGSGLAPLQRFVTLLLAGLERYDGILLSAEPSESGVRWLVAFGAPTAHEDDPERAARLALDLLAERARRRLPELRGGGHTGVCANIWLGTDRRRSYELMGDVTNTAARCCARASWGEIWVTQTLAAELPGIALQPRGQHRVKGKAAPLSLVALAGSAGALPQVRVMARLVGRDRELATIRDALDAALEGRGGALQIRGEAGIGKSRLKLEAARLARERGFEVLEGRARAFGGAPYEAVAALLRASLELPADAGATELLAALSSLPVDETTRRHLAEVLGLREPGSPVEALDGRTILRNNLAALESWLEACGRAAPRLWVLEDLHWADALTREAAAALAHVAGRTRGLLLMLARPVAAPLRGVPELPLQPLGDAGLAELLGELLGSVPERIARTIHERADGNPFYVEELVRHLLETGHLTISDRGYEVAARLPDELPGRLETLLEARLDTLPHDVRSIVQTCSVMGRTFPAALVRRVAGEDVDDRLEELLRRELLVREPGDEAPAMLTFKHALVREAAYATLLGTARRRRHRAVARALERDARAADAALLGHHWEHAGDTRRAAPHYLAAAEAATIRFALDDAELAYRAHLRVAPAGEARVRSRTALGRTVLAARGRYAEAVVELEQARDEAARLPDRAPLAAALHGLAVTLRTLGRGTEAIDLMDRALRVAEEVGDLPLVGVLLGTIGRSHLEAGRTELCEAFYVRARDVHLRTRNQRNLAMLLESMAILRSEQGRLDESVELHGQALALARQCGHLGLQGQVLGNLATVELTRSNLAAATRLFAEALAIHQRTGHRRSEAVVRANMGSAAIHAGRTDEAWATLQAGLATARELGDRHLEGFTLSALAACAYTAGELPRAEGLALESITVLEAGGYKAELAVAVTNLGMAKVGSGRDATAELARARALVQEIGAGAASEAGLSVAKLEEAIARARTATSWTAAP